MLRMKCIVRMGNLFAFLVAFMCAGCGGDSGPKTFMIKGKAQINPVFVFFSILGGLTIFGFWGVVIGPLIVSLAVTIFHIYEIEFCDEAIED